MVSPESFPLHIWLISLRLEARPGPFSCTQSCLSQAECLRQGHPRHPSLEQCSVGRLRGLMCVKLLLCACCKHITHYSTPSILKRTSSPRHTLRHREVEWLAQGHTANKWQNQEGLDSSSGLKTFTCSEKTMPSSCLKICWRGVGSSRSFEQLSLPWGACGLVTEVTCTEEQASNLFLPLNNCHQDSNQL